MSDLDSQLHHEKFKPDPRFRKCPECKLYAYFDVDYKPMRVAWKNRCYACMIRGESDLLKAKADGLDLE